MPNGEVITKEMVAEFGRKKPPVTTTVALEEPTDLALPTRQKLPAIDDRVTEERYFPFFKPPPEPEEEKGFFANLRDSFYLGAIRLGHDTKQAFLSAIPNYIFREKHYPEWYPASMREYQEQLNKNRRKLQDTLSQKYQQADVKHQEWLEAHPELQPPKVLEQGIWAAIEKDPKVFLDAGALGYIIGESAAFTIAFLGTTLAVTGVTGNPFLGLAAGVAVTAPAQIQDLNEDLIASGATEEQAAQLAVPIGIVISSVEIVGAIPLLNAISKPFTNILRRNIQTEIAKRTVAELVKRGLITFTQVEIAEVMEEVVQGAIQDATVKTFDENRDLLANIPETVIRTAIATLPFALLGVGGQAMMERGIVPPIEPTVEVVKPPAVTPEVPITPPPTVPEAIISPRAVEEVSIELEEVTAEIEGLTEYLATEPARKLINVIKKTGWRRGEISNLTLKQYRDITGKTTISPTILTADKKHVRWEYSLDEIATEMGYESGEALRETIVTTGEANTRLSTLKNEKARLTAEIREVEAPVIGIQLPKELPTTPPPLTPVAEVLGRTSSEWTGSMVDLQDAQEVSDIAFRNDMVRQWVTLLPEIHGLMRILNPSAIANTPAERAIIVRATLRDEAIQKSQGVISYLSELGSQEKVFGKLNEKGEIASRKFKGLTVGDIAQSFKKYESQMTGAEKEWLNRANDIENAVKDYFIRNDIDINLLALEEGGHFATRRVWVKVVEGEVLDVRYAGPGPGRPGAKIATEKRRWFKTEADAIKEGYRYLPYDQALFLKVQGAYNRVADKQAADWLLLQVPWRTTGAPEELILAAEQARLKYRHSQQLLAVLNRAVRGERVPNVTINSIARSYPDQAQELKDLIPLLQEGAPTAKRVQNLTRVAKGLVETNKSVSQRAINARARARERALKVKYEEAVIPAPAFAGKILTGAEAKKTARVLREAFDPGFSKALAAVNKANAMVRFLILAGDASPFGIQLIFLPGAHPVVAAKAMRGYIGALFSPEFLASYKTKHKATIDKHPILILPELGTVEMTEAMARGGWLAGKQTLLPQNESYWKNLAFFIPRVFGKGAGYVLTPFARAYAGAMTVAGIEMAEMLDYMCTTPERTADVDQHINVFRGMTSSARIGVTPHWQQVERASILAPMYNRGIAALLFDAGTKGGIRGAQARWGLGKGISALIAMGVLISLARGETPEEILDHWNPNSPNFVTWDVAGQRIGPGSKVRSVVKVWAQSVENPESLFQLSMDNPALRFIRGNLAPVISTGLDLITGRNYIGDPTRDGMLSFSKEMLAGNLLPIWVQSVLLEGGNVTGRITRGITEFFGGRAYPEPLWGEVGRLRDKYAKMDFNVKYEELNRAQIDKLRSNHPDLVDLEEKARVDAATRGTEFEKWLIETKEQIVQERNDALEKAAYALLTGLMSKQDYDSERKYARPYYSGGMAVLWSARETLDPYAVRQIEKWMGENQKPEDIALDKYLEYRGNLIAKADLPKDWDKIEKQTETYLAKLSKPIRGYVIANSNRWIEALPPNAQKVERMRIAGIEDESWWTDYRGTAKPTSPFPKTPSSFITDEMLAEFGR